MELVAKRETRDKIHVLRSGKTTIETETFPIRVVFEDKEGHTARDIPAQEFLYGHLRQGDRFHLTVRLTEEQARRVGRIIVIAPPEPAE